MRGITRNRFAQTKLKKLGIEANNLPSLHTALNILVTGCIDEGNAAGENVPPTPCAWKALP